MGKRATMIVAVVFALPALAAAQGMDSVKTDSNVRPQFSDYATEAMGAYGCGCLATVPMYAAAMLYALVLDGREPDEGLAVSFVCLAVGYYTFGSAAAANWVGNKNGWSGSFGWSWGLSALTVVGGLGLAAVLVTAAADDASGRGYYYAAEGVGLLCLAGAPAMATVGYNIGARRRTPSSLQNRLGTPCFSARLERPHEPGQHRAVALDARLLTVRF